MPSSRAGGSHCRAADGLLLPAMELVLAPRPSEGSDMDGGSLERRAGMASFIFCCVECRL